MLYITTRSKHDAYTAHRTMNQDCGSDGGLFIPMRMPVLNKEELSALADKSFGQNVADILNLFFSTKLTGWDVDVSIGRYPTKLHSMNHRMLVVELWHNIDGNFDRVVNSLAAKIHPDGEFIGKPTNWVALAIRIAVLFGLFGELLRNEQVRFDRSVDVAVTAGSFSAPMAVWYARYMGLPIGTIVCGCNENGAPWDLLHRGEVDTDALAVKTTTPESDFALPPDLERLICATLGQEESMRYWWSCTEGAVYAPPEAKFDELRKGMFAAVVSRARVETIIPSVYRTNQYILDTYAALAYGALSDYRARTGASGMALLLTEKSPMCNAGAVADAMHITPQELKKRLAEV